MLYHTLFKKLILINRQVIDRQMDMHNKQQDLDLLAGHIQNKELHCWVPVYGQPGWFIF